MPDNYLTADDIAAITGKSFTADEYTRLNTLIPIACAELRAEGTRWGVDADARIHADEDYALLAHEILATAIMRWMASDSADSPMSQTTESALGYSVSGTFIVPGGGFYLTAGEKRRLGFLRQRWGVIDFTYSTEG